MTDESLHRIAHNLALRNRRPRRILISWPDFDSVTNTLHPLGAAMSRGLRRIELFASFGRVSILPDRHVVPGSWVAIQPR